MIIGITLDLNRHDSWNEYNVMSLLIMDNKKLVIIILCSTDSADFTC